MSSIDKRIVEMSFDNKQFESGVQTSLKSLENLRGGLDDTGKNNALAGLSSGVQTISDKFSALGVMGITALQNITNSAINFGKNIISALTVDPIMAGLSEYETQINSVQTILANTQGSQKKVSQEAVSAINETAVSATNAAKQANEAALENLKNTQQKQLKEHEKLADEELKILKNRYEEESNALDKAINKENSELKDSHQEKISLIDEELKVLKNRYDEGSEALDKAIAKENRDLKEAHQEKLSIYQDEYMAKLKTIDEERYNKLKAIDDEIAAINNLTKTEKEAQEISEQNKKLQELQSKVRDAEDIKERVKAEERLMEYKEELRQKQILKERQQRIDLLKDNKDAIKEEYKLAEEQAKDDYKNKKDQENELHQTTVENLKEEHSEKKKLLKSDYESEKELLKDKQDSENKLYEAKSANLKEEQAEKKKLLKDIYETEKESVQDRQNAEKDALKDRQSAEIASLKKYNDSALVNIEARKKAELKALTEISNVSTKASTLEDVNKALDELNEYADKTIYNFTEMTRNIGTFTAAGVDLDTSVQAIKGIANLAAVSGSTSQQASTAMYQLSQAISSGTVKLQDWNSVVNAGMGGQVFQDALKETARVHGIAIDQMIMEEGSFRETLKNGWLTSEVLTETLSKFTGDLNEEQLRTMGYTEEQIKSIIKMGQTAKRV